MPCKWFFQDVIILEEKKMNNLFKSKYLLDFAEEFNPKNRSKFRRRKIGASHLKNKELQKQTLLALAKTINSMDNIDEYNVKKVNDEWIRGPMKWIILILGQNTAAKDISSLLKKEYTNLNIIVLYITHEEPKQKVHKNIFAAAMQK